MGKNNIHGDGAKFIFEIADIEDDHRVINVDVGLLREDTGEGTSGVFAEALSELRTGAAHVK